MKLKLSILALFILVAISVKGAVVDTVAVYNGADMEEMRKPGFP